MTIEERAKKYCESYKDSYKGQAFQDFMAGAAEQRKIDIDKACEWIDEYFPTRGNGESTFIRIEAVKECFRKAMED